MSKIKIAVLGLGASGIFAAKAAEDCGCEVTAFTNKTKIEFPPGPFWLHWIPEDLQHMFKPTPIYHIGKGTAAGYQTLQWGRIPAGKFSNSFPIKDKYLYGYNPEKVLPFLLPKRIKFLSALLTDNDIELLAECYDFIFQTFPTNLSKQTQSALLPYLMASRFGLEDPDKNFVIYNGTDEDIIVREINLWGNKFYEFPKHLPIAEIQRVMPLPGFSFKILWDLSPFTKLWRQPVEANKKIHLVGRWAEWNNKRLSHEVYAIVYEMLHE